MGISQCYLQSSDAKVLMIIQKISEKISSSHLHGMPIISASYPY